MLYWLQLQLWGNGMANRQQLSILKQGTLPWNEWRKKNPDVRPDLYEASLAGANLRGANLSGANLGGAELASADLQEVNLLGATAVEANLHEANLHKADLGFADLTFAHLSSANLTTARLWKADLTAAKLSSADLSAADLTMAMLRETDFSGANLYEAILDYAILVETNLRQANLTGCSVCGLSAWNVHLEGANQENLVITSHSEPTITVDTLDVAQLLYLLLNKKQIHGVITSMTSNMVLILGRFTPERKPILEAIRDELRERQYTPLLFNFVFRKNCVLSYLARWWLFSRCSMEPAGCIPCSLTSSNIPMFSQVIVTMAWRACKQHSRKKSSNPLKRKQRNWKDQRKYLEMGPGNDAGASTDCVRQPGPKEVP